MISSQTATLVVDSFRAVSSQREALIAKFYERLFDQHPELKPMFAKVDKVGLRRKLLLALITIVDGLEDNEELYQSLQGISETHLRIQVKREHFVIFGEILIEVLAEFLPEVWTDETALAWKDALDHVTEMIITIGEHKQ